MLKIATSMKELDFAQLVAVNVESIENDGKVKYPYLSTEQLFLRAQDDFYAYLLDFFRENDTFYALWVVDGTYRSSLRVERYLDGMIVTGLETHPEARCLGYATALLRHVLLYLSAMGIGKIYSHVDHRNRISASVHGKCGFRPVADFARYLDGSVSSNAYTLCFET